MHFYNNIKTLLRRQKFFLFLFFLNKEYRDSLQTVCTLHIHTIDVKNNEFTRREM